MTLYVGLRNGQFIRLSINFAPCPCPRVRPLVFAPLCPWFLPPGQHLQPASNAGMVLRMPVILLYQSLFELDHRILSMFSSISLQCLKPVREHASLDAPFEKATKKVLSRLIANGPTARWIPQPAYHGSPWLNRINFRCLQHIHMAFVLSLC
jgi:hypothetical protein